jgi:putative cardiolipin synthase
MNPAPQTRTLTTWLASLFAMLLTACATMPPGTDYPKPRSSALAHPEETRVGRTVEALAKAHPGLSGFRLFASGSDAFTLRVQMADRAERTLDRP